MDLNEDQLLDIAFDAALSGVTSMPPRVWDEISGALLAGPSPKPLQNVAWKRSDGHTSPLTAFIDTTAEFGELLDSLTEGDWERRTRIDGIGVRDLVEHLVGMERYLLGQLGRRPLISADRREDHWPTWPIFRMLTLPGRGGARCSTSSPRAASSGRTRGSAITIWSVRWEGCS